MYKLILLDTNILIGILNSTIDVKDLPLANSYAVSVVTVMELYALAGMSKSEEKRIDQALQELEIINLDFTISKRAGILARTRKRGKADLLIAATAIEANISLFTFNKKDFRNITNLKLVED